MDFQTKPPSLSRLVFTADGATLIGASLGGDMNLWDMPSGSVRTTFSTHEVLHDLALLDGEEFAVAGGSSVRFWSWRTGSALGVLRWPDITFPESLRVVRYNPAAKLAAILYGQRVQIWDAAGDQWILLHQFDAPDFLEALSFDPGGQLLAFGSQDGVLSIMDTTTGEILANFDADRAEKLAFSPDGRLLAVASLTGEVELRGIPRVP